MSGEFSSSFLSRNTGRNSAESMSRKSTEKKFARPKRKKTTIRLKNRILAQPNLNQFKAMWNKLENIGKLHELASTGVVSSSVVILSKENLFKNAEMKDLKVTENRKPPVKVRNRVSQLSSFKPIRRKGASVNFNRLSLTKVGKMSGGNRLSKSMKTLRRQNSNKIDLLSSLQTKLNLKIFIQKWYGVDAFVLVNFCEKTIGKRSDIKKLRSFLTSTNLSNSKIAYNWAVLTMVEQSKKYVEEMEIRSGVKVNKKRRKEKDKKIELERQSRFLAAIPIKKISLKRAITQCHQQRTSVLEDI